MTDVVQKLMVFNCRLVLDEFQKFHILTETRYKKYVSFDHRETSGLNIQQNIQV